MLHDIIYQYTRQKSNIQIRKKLKGYRVTRIEVIALLVLVQLNLVWVNMYCIDNDNIIIIIIEFGVDRKF